MTHGFNLDLVEKLQDQGQNLELQREAPRSPRDLGKKLVEWWGNAAIVAQASLVSAQDRQERGANRKRSAGERYQVGDKVWLRLKNVCTDRPCKSLDFLALPYRVIEVVGSHSYRLNTPRGIHNVFHSDLLKKAAEDPLPSQSLVNVDNPPISVDSSEEYEVEEIMRHRKQGRGWRVLVKWVGYQQPTWEPLRELEDTAALKRYEQEKGPPWVD